MCQGARTICRALNGPARARRLQSAMEYLMTYGWAILVIAVVLGVLYSLGIFNPSNFAPKAQPGSCQVLRPNGPGTNYDLNLEGTCGGELPQYIAWMDGSASPQVSVPDTGNWTRIENFTVSFWINPVKSTQNQWPKYVGFEGCGGGDGWIVSGGEYNNPPYVSISFSAPSPSCWSFGGPSAPISANGWSLVVYTVNIPGNVISVYTDGKLRGTSAADGQYYAGQGTFGIGYEGMEAGFANVQFYNGTLSANSIMSLYDEGVGGVPIELQKLVGWWPLNGNANDYSGNGNNGVPSNAIYTGAWQEDYTAP